MDENPYESPQGDGEPITSHLRVPSRREAKVKGFVLALLVQFIYLPVSDLLIDWRYDSSLLFYTIAVYMLAGVLFSMQWIFRLSRPSTGTLVALLHAALMVVPYLALVVLVLARIAVKAELQSQEEEEAVESSRP